MKELKETLLSMVQEQMLNPQDINTHELGEVIDMIKDLAEAMYYCTIVEAMENGSNVNINSGNGSISTVGNT